MTTENDDLDAVLAALLADHPHPLPEDVARHVALHPRHAAAIRSYAGEVMATAIDGGGIFGIRPDAAELESFRERARARYASAITPNPGPPDPTPATVDTKKPMSEEAWDILAGFRPQKAEKPKVRPKHHEH